jgi:TPR repeat protein/predicted Ser/Thr protein kinase
MSPENNPQSLPPCYRLDEYQILRELGSGGFGITYLATDTSLEREVVIKENLPMFAYRDPASSLVHPKTTRGEEVDLFQWSLESFAREAKTLAKFDHPNIVKVLRVFQANNTAYFVMPYVEGVTFGDLIERKRGQGKAFSREEIEAVLLPLLDGLETLHAQGVYHRDIKPGNILITKDGGRPVLIDFGAARQMVSEKSHTVIESPGYTPFEQLQSRGNVGPWSDIYALAGTLYKAITFESPPKANDRVRNDPAKLLVRDTELSGRYGIDFLDAVDRAFRFDEGERWQSAGEWRAAIVDGENVAAKTPPPVSSPAPMVAKQEITLASGGQSKTTFMVFAACVAVGLIVWGTARLGKRDGVLESLPPSKLEEEIDMATLAPAEWEKHANAGDGYAQALLARHCWYGGLGQPIDHTKAKQWAEKSAAQNHPLGLYMMGRITAKDASEPSQETRDANARLWYEKAVKEGFLSPPGDKAAAWMEALGGALIYGRGAPKDEVGGLQWVRKAADLRDASAFAMLGFLHDSGACGLTQDPQRAMDFYRKAAELGNPTAMTNLAGAYERGVGGMPKSEADALAWYQKAAGMGEARAMASVAWSYESGWAGVKKDEREAVRWYSKSAELGDGGAMERLGIGYLHGNLGLRKDETKAAGLLKKAADLGRRNAYCPLGWLYENGKGGLEQDYQQALKWYRLSAEAGYDGGMHNLGFLYWNGFGIAQDKEEALEWYRKAAENGNRESQIALGGILKERNTRNDWQEAAQWYEKAIVAGDGLAEYNLGGLYDPFFKKLADGPKAGLWYRRAADKGNAGAMANLGFLYKSGNGGEQNEQEAVRWYRKAAVLGDPVGMRNLARCYETGAGGLEKSRAEAAKWYRKAAAAGDENAREYLAGFEE